MLVIQSKKQIDAEIKNIKNKYFTTSDYNKFTNNILCSKITSKKLVNEPSQNEKIKLPTKEKMNKLATKAELKAEQDKRVKLQTYDFKSFYWSKLLCQ